MVGALDPSCSPSVFMADLSENVVRRTEIAASAVANFFLLLITAWWSAASIVAGYVKHLWLRYLNVYPERM